MSTLRIATGESDQHCSIAKCTIISSETLQIAITLFGPIRCRRPTVRYQEFLEAIKDPKHEEHESYFVWVGGEFDPEAFDIDETNGVLPDYKQMDAGNW